jgi:hypothetical protein
LVWRKHQPEPVEPVEQRRLRGAAQPLARVRGREIEVVENGNAGRHALLPIG